MYKSNQGIALISVLMAASILAWVISFFLLESKNQLNLMQLIQNRVTAEIHADSMVDEIIFFHFSKRYLQEDELKDWNYSGREFNYNDMSKISLQDADGKISISSMNPRFLGKFLNVSGMSPFDTSVFLDCLADWQDADSLSRLNGGEAYDYELLQKKVPRNNKIQSLSELSLLCGFPNELSDVFFENILLQGGLEFNPRYASENLIRASNLPKDRQDILIKTRKKKNIKKVFETNESGVNILSFNLSNTIELDLTTKVGEAISRRHIVFNYNLRYKPRPVIQYWHWSE